MRKTLASLILIADLCLSSCSSPPPKRRGPPQVPVTSKVYPSGIVALRASILSIFSKDLPSTFRGMKVIELKPPNYSADWIITVTDPGGFLESYKQLPANLRAQDILIEEPTGDVYWQSEYVSGDGVSKFRCGFIVHFTDLNQQTTEVQVYEKSPAVWLGEAWGLSRHGIGFGKFHDIRFVEPTVKDRLDLLKLIHTD